MESRELQYRPRAVYVCAPRTGVKDKNAPAILGCASALASLGYVVINPVLINLNVLGVPYSPDLGGRPAFPGLRADIIALLTVCDGIALMPGWDHSKGCKLEVALAITFRYAFVDWQTGEVIDRPSAVTIDQGYGEILTELLDVQFHD